MTSVGVVKKRRSIKSAMEAWDVWGAVCTKTKQNVL